jgi:predicted benzoate:H+ symporter BenE
MLERPPTRALAGTLAFVVGCAGTNATIYRTDGPPIEAEVDSSDASMIRLRGSRGRLLDLDQHQVSSIDHPGNVLAAIGAGYAGASGLMALMWYGHQRSLPAEERGSGVVTGGFIFGMVLGLVTFVPNIIVWKRSKARAGAFEAARPPAQMIPPAFPGEVEPLEPLGPRDDEAADKKPPATFHR